VAADQCAGLPDRVSASNFNSVLHKLLLLLLLLHMYHVFSARVQHECTALSMYSTAAASKLFELGCTATCPMLTLCWSVSLFLTMTCCIMYYVLYCTVTCHYSVSLISVSGGSAATGGAAGSSTGTATQASSTISKTERDFSKVTRPTTTSTTIHILHCVRRCCQLQF
jgi:hypothetical protein